MSTLKSVNLQHPSSASPNIVLDSSGNATMAGSMAMATPFAMRNKIINGAMEIDQRNAGASGTAISYTVDRWYFAANLATKGTWQQNAGSVTPPAGFINYLGFTSNSAYSVAATDYFSFSQAIEGLNVADLGWGTANAKTITISFWVRSSLTGTFGSALQNSGSTRSYPFSYTINSANTWEQKSITILGDTSGTWLTTNGIGISVYFSLGTGTTYSGTAGAWAGTAYISSTGATSVVGTNGATFYLTGVQLEVGSVATPFERRIYSQELAMCQRYAYRLPSLSNSAGIIATVQSATVALAYPQNPVPMRGAPSVTFAGSWDFSVTGGGVTITALAANTTDTNSIQVEATVSGQTTGQAGRIRSGYYIASSEL